MTHPLLTLLLPTKLEWFTLSEFNDLLEKTENNQYGRMLVVTTEYYNLSIHPTAYNYQKDGNFLIIHSERGTEEMMVHDNIVAVSLLTDWSLVYEGRGKSHNGQLTFGEK